MMDTSGFIICPFCCLGFLFSGLSAQLVGFLLSKGQLLTGFTRDQIFGIKLVIFVIGLVITYFAISYIFRDLYVM
jgi:hypothetical protein